MAEGFDVAQALGDGAVNRAGVWRFVKAFSASWETPLSPGDGFTPAEIRSAEERLGLGLPAALREAYLLFGRRNDLIAGQNPLLGPDELLLDPSGRLLVFRSENQGCAGWGVPLTELSADDPSVALFSDHLPRFSWRPFLDRLSLACVEAVLSEAVMARRYGPQGRECRATPELIAWVETAYEPVALPLHPTWYQPAGAPVRWFSAPGRLLCLEPAGTGQNLVVVGREKADLLEVVRTVPGDWPAANPAQPDRTTDECDMVLPF